MKNMIKTIVMCSALAATLSACSETPQKEKVIVEINNTKSSEELTEAGEQLVAPYTLNLAYRAFEMALEKNPNDMKALFYQKFLKRFMVLRGVGTNVKPIVQKYGNISQYENEVKKAPAYPIKKFLMTPEKSAPIKSESGIQNIFIEYRKALVEFRQFIAHNPDLTLDLRMNPYVFQAQINDRLEQNCVIVEDGENSKYECDLDGAATVRLNIADLMVLKQEAAAEILYVTLYASYNLDGFIDYAKAIEGKGVTAQQATDVILEKVNLSVLDKEGLKSIKSIATDMLVAVKWVQKYSDKLCPNPAGDTRRKGHLIENGSIFCVRHNAEFDNEMAKIEQAINGAITVNVADGSTTSIDAMAFFNNPVSSLKQLAPAKWSTDGQSVESFQDNTMGGVFVNGDAVKVLNGNK
ncbi:hypothetical protein ACLVWU_01775 [Bdellovibrio sp. HCB290]|uniref:hypothetical protein n=1 Tax=Bdellovibrio sp. HCB290 TaxID=3394356 RepID=UPI0039B3CC0E